jgi:autotransporter-associated beta strand protein
VALLLAPIAIEASPDTLSGLNPAWATGGNWSLGFAPGVGDNALITATGIVDVNGAALGGLRELQDITFSALNNVTLANGSNTTAMVLALNGGRGAGVPLIQTGGNVAYTIQGPGTGVPANSLGVQLNASGSISVGSTLIISSVISQSGGARSLIKTGVGRLKLSGANSYSGGMTVSDGTLEAASNGALGTGAAIINGGTLEINQANTTLSVSSVTVNTGARIAVRNGSVLNNAVTLAGGTLTTHETDTGIFAGAVNVTGNSFADLRSYIDPGTDLDLTISGVLSGNGSLTISGNDGGGKALILTKAGNLVTGNSFSGHYFINSGQTLRAMPTTPTTPTTTGNLGTGTVHLSGSTLQVRDNGTADFQTLPYGNNIEVQSGGGTIDVDRASGSTATNTIRFGALTIGQQTLNFTGGNSYRVRIQGPTTLTGAATFNPTTARAEFGGVVSGAFDFTKTGSGFVSFFAANTYTGQTNVNGGVLTVTSTGSIANSPVINVASGATFDVAAVAGGFQLTASHTLAGSGTVSGSTSNRFTVANGGAIIPGGNAGTGVLNMNYLKFGSVAGDTASVNFVNAGTPAILRVNSTDGLSANGGANSVTVNVSGAAPFVGTYPLIDYVGTVGGTGIGAFQLGTLPVRVIGASLVHNAAQTRFDLVVNSVDSAVWKGALSNEWSNTVLTSPKNWVLSSNNATTTDFLVGDSVTFTDIAIRTTVDISVTDVVPSLVTFNNTTQDFTITGIHAITGVGGLTKNGTGKVTIENSNSFTGPVTLNAGTVRVYELADATLPSGIGAGNSIAFNGGTLEFLGSFGSTNRTISLGAGGGTVRNDLDLTLAGVISGAGRLTKSGDGILTLAAANTYATTTISGGTLEIGPGGTLGSGTVTNNATLSFNSFNAVIVNNVIQGNGTVKQVGFGTVTLGGATANTYTGVTEISNGTLIAGKTANITAIPGDLVINSGGAFRYLGNNVSNQIANTASITIYAGGSFGDPNNPPTNPGATDTVANVTVNGGTFNSGRNVTIGAFTITGTLYVLGGGVANAQRGGVISAQTARIDDGFVNLDGGSGTMNNESRLDVGPGGLHLAGGTINFNIGGVAAGSVGSILRLSGNVTSSGNSFFVHSIPGLANAIVDLRGATRTFDVEDTLQIGTVAAPLTIQNGILTKTGTGTLILAGTQTYNPLNANEGTTTLQTALGTGTSTVNANAEVVFEADQTLGILNIGPNGIVRLGSAAPAPALAAAPEETLAEQEVASEPDEILAGPAQAIPEPNLTALLLLGATALLGRRRRE